MKKEEKIVNTAICRDTRQLDNVTGNLYESTVIIAKRSNQISVQSKEEMHKKLDEFIGENDNLEEIFENREQIEIATYFEQQPKPTLTATDEFLKGKIYFRNPAKGDVAK
ncbi:MAG: DNA-directed RNA polymerase subunit omega [Bacteroidetes bacterium]|nr:DNA-directed RNA polymerase subunit omega [Bacteroidota bacterium]